MKTDSFQIMTNQPDSPQAGLSSVSKQAEGTKKTHLKSMKVSENFSTALERLFSDLWGMKTALIFCFMGFSACVCPCRWWLWASTLATASTCRAPGTSWTDCWCLCRWWTSWCPLHQRAEIESSESSAFSGCCERCGR